MDFSFTDEQELLVESIEEFCERYAGEDEIKEMYENRRMSEELTSAWMESGFGLMGIPEEYGGSIRTSSPWDSSPRSSHTIPARRSAP